MAAVTCEQCDPPREFANGGALRFHAIAKHGADAGTCPECGKHFARLTQHQRKAHPIDPATADVPTSGPGAVAGGGANPDDDNAERPPAVGDYLADADRTAPPTSGRRKLSDRVRSRLWGKDATAADTAGAGLYTTPGEKKPRPKVLGKRADTSAIMSLLWSGSGALLERTGADIPVGRTLQFQGPAAGEILDRLIARTWVDRIVQPFAAKADDVEALGALLAMPTLVAMIERSPAAAVSLEPILRQVIAANLISMAPSVKKKKAEAKKLADVVRELDPDLAASGADPVDTILAAIFAAPQEPPPSPNGSEDADHARATPAV